MAKAFIIYSHDDKDFVDQLSHDLENSGVEIALDSRVVAPGDSLLEIFGEIGTSDFLLPVLSPSSIASPWVRKELTGAIVKEIEEQGFTVIPIMKENCELPLEIGQALRDKCMARFDTKDYDTALKELLKKLTPQQPPSDLYATIQSPRSENPFRRVRAEYFEDLQILANSFSEPEKARYDRIAEVKPAVIEGGRGSGKTMILKSLQAQVAVPRMHKQTFVQAALDYFGVYCRCSQGSFSTQSRAILDKLGLDISARIFMTEFLLKLTSAFIGELQECSVNGLISMRADEEQAVTTEIAQIIRPTYPNDKIPRDFRSLQGFLRSETSVAAEYVGRRILEEEPEYTGIFLDVDRLKQICGAIRTTVGELKGKTVYFLLDEYENLLPFQKILINTLIKWSEAGCFSVKVATKKTAFDNPQTLERQEIQESHDYSSVDIDYNISDEQQRKDYQNLLVHVCERILGHEKFTETDIRKLLEPSQLWDGIDEREIEQELLVILRPQNVTDLDHLPENKLKEYRHRLGNAVLYRVLWKSHRGRRKQFAGFEDFTFLSSGIIRYFLELCGMSYYFAAQSNVNVKAGQVISSAQQTEAAHILSAYYLSTLKKNIADIGPGIQRLVIDLGDIFRAKLLYHLSEPEAARLAIVDPQWLEEALAQQVKMILDLGEMHSVFQIPGVRGGIRPKHIADVQPKEYILNRIYSPILQISLHPRWRTKVTFKDIRGLLDATTRTRTKSKLIRQVRKAVPKTPLF